jgi:uncharacterized protein (DUF433 family)
MMQITLDRHIDIDPAIRGGKPRIADTRITVADIVIMHLRMGQSLEEIAGTYDLDPAAVHAAMAYYYDHREEVDKAIEEDRAFADALRERNPSRLQHRLRPINNGQLLSEQ